MDITPETIQAIESADKPGLKRIARDLGIADDVDLRKRAEPLRRDMLALVAPEPEAPAAPPLPEPEREPTAAATPVALSEPPSAPAPAPEPPAPPAAAPKGPTLYKVLRGGYVSAQGYRHKVQTGSIVSTAHHPVQEMMDQGLNLEQFGGER